MAEGKGHTELRSANRARQIEWDQDNQITLAYRGNELAGEVGEACNVIKKLERERMGIRGSRATKEQLAEELADVVICADLIAMDAGIDLLNEAVPAKFNATSEKVGLQTRLAVNTYPAVEGLVKALEDLKPHFHYDSGGDLSWSEWYDLSKKIDSALSRFRSHQNGGAE